MSDIDEVDLPVLMSIVKDKLENPDRAWFLEVKLNAREWERLVKVWISQNEDDLQSMIMVAEDKAKKQGALEELEKDVVALKKNLDEIAEIYVKLFEKQNNTQSMAFDIACESRIKCYNLFEKYVKGLLREKRKRIKELEECEKE